MSRIIFDGESLIILKPRVMTSSLLFTISYLQLELWNTMEFGCFSWKFAYNTELIYVSTDMWSKGRSIINV